MKTLKTLLLAAVIGSMPAAALAQMGPSSAQFSAEFVQSDPQGGTNQGAMYVSKGRMRTEMSQGGQEMVQIVNPKAGKSWIIFPDRKQYIEQRIPPEPAGRKADSPCAGMPGWTCKKLGEEEIFGRRAEHWVFEGEHQGQTVTQDHWIDAEREIPLKQDLGGGAKMENKIVGTQTLHGRMVEKWEQTMTMPGQPPIKTLQWYDPKLEMIVREERDGQWREMRDIQVGPQPEDLFQPPKGYTRVAQPQGSGFSP